MSMTDEQARELYEKIKHKLDAAYQDKVEADVARGYSHDLVAGIAKGHRNAARDLIREAVDQHELSATYGRGRDRTRSGYTTLAMLLHDAIFVAARDFELTPEDARRVLQRELDCSDSTSIEKTIARAKAGA